MEQHRPSLFYICFQLQLTGVQTRITFTYITIFFVDKRISNITMYQPANIRYKTVGTFTINMNYKIKICIYRIFISKYITAFMELTFHIDLNFRGLLSSSNIVVRPLSAGRHCANQDPFLPADSVPSMTPFCRQTQCQL